MTSDAHLDEAAALLDAALRGQAPIPAIRTFFDEATYTATHVVWDPDSKAAAIIDSVLDFDAASGCTSTESADAIIAFAEAEGLHAEWLIETHVHADHLSAAPYLQQRLGGRIAIGHEILTVQAAFGKIFNEGTDFARDGSQFDRLFVDGDRFAIGSIPVIALHVPGHTPADMAYVVGDAVFVGDTLFMPDYGSARADFPGGNARCLYRSIRRLLALPDRTRLFLCHDYKAPGRDVFAWETTVEAERSGNLHVRDGVDEDAFVAMREARDATLCTPRLLLPSIQVNMRAGHFPEPDENGTCYLKLPLNVMGGAAP
jgi:glyoxylase-like metal-dependent hydrolase (beta-lactamase superfamily II)